MTDSADLVVVGGGTIGGWASYFAASSLGKGRVIDVDGRSRLQADPIALPFPVVTD